MNAPGAAQKDHSQAPDWVQHAGLRQWVSEIALLAKPARIVWCDGSQPEYDRLCAELVSSRSFPIMGMRIAATPEAVEIAKRIAERGPEVAPMVRVIRSTRLTGLIYGSIGDYLRLITNGVEISRALFVSDLVNILVAAVRADGPRED